MGIRIPCYLLPLEGLREGGCVRGGRFSPALDTGSSLSLQSLANSLCAWFPGSLSLSWKSQIQCELHQNWYWPIASVLRQGSVSVGPECHCRRTPPDSNYPKHLFIWCSNSNTNYIPQLKKIHENIKLKMISFVYKWISIFVLFFSKLTFLRERINSSPIFSSKLLATCICY